MLSEVSLGENRTFSNIRLVSFDTTYVPRTYDKLKVYPTFFDISLEHSLVDNNVCNYRLSMSEAETFVLL